MSNNHVMIDIETLGTKPGSVIASIGAVRFDPHAGVQSTKDLKTDSFKATLDISEQLDEGMTVDGSTILWWFNQSGEAKQATFFDKTKRMSSNNALLGLWKFINGVTSSGSGAEKGDTKVWGNGANFDPVLIEALCAKMYYGVPWRYSNVRCYRTLKNSLPVATSFSGDNELAHDCLSDAIYQARYLQALVSENPGLKL